MRALWINELLWECYHLHEHLTQSTNYDRLNNASNIFFSFHVKCILLLNFALQVSPQIEIKRWQTWRTWGHKPLLTIRLSLRNNRSATETNQFTVLGQVYLNKKQANKIVLFRKALISSVFCNSVYKLDQKTKWNKNSFLEVAVQTGRF